MEYRQIASSVYVVTMIVPNIADAFCIINTFLIAINVISIVIAILIIILLVRKIVRPLDEFQAFTEHMENNQFLPVQIHTNDELEDVADSLNSMGNRIVQYQSSLKEKNQIIFTISNETDNRTLDVSQIWEPYYVGEKSRNKNLSGTGLGLSIARKICETQNYKIECSLQGGNLTFTIVIPL